MKYPGHLFADEATLRPAVEWSVAVADWLFVYLKTGEACWTDGRTPLLLDAGDTLVVPPRHNGAVRASLVASATIVYFRFCPELLTGFLTLPERLRSEQVGKGAASRVRVFHRVHAISRNFSGFCELEDKTGAVARSQLLQIAVSLIAQKQPVASAEESAFLPASKRAPLLFRQLCEAELLQLSPAELAERCRCSVRHFHKLFRHHFGVPLRIRQPELKLIKARELLDDTDLPVFEIAEAVGFQERGMFSNAFKRRFGVTPSQWRLARAENLRNGQGVPPGNGAS